MSAERIEEPISRWEWSDSNRTEVLPVIGGYAVVAIFGARPGRRAGRIAVSNPMSEAAAVAEHHAFIFEHSERRPS